MRDFKRKLGGRTYRDYTPEQLKEALACIRKTRRSPDDVGREYGIPGRTLRDKLSGRHTNAAGHPTALGKEVEESLVIHLKTVAKWGMPLTILDLRNIVKSYLDSMKMKVLVFVDNRPGRDWAFLFLKRNKEQLTTRLCQNIKSARARVGRNDIQEYFDNLKTEKIEDIPADHILNYDETNFVDNPGTKKMIFHRGVKYPERVINFSKGNVTVMFSATASGTLLPPFVVYKANKMWSSWCLNGPKGCRYSNTPSGWFDGPMFEEWFTVIVVPWARKLSGQKLIIGDNLSAHISHRVIELCEQHKIKFILLPPNTTHLTQPLDVCVYRPMKIRWREVVEKYKTSNPLSVSIEKSRFPFLLKSMLENMKESLVDDIISGFETAGIRPLDPSKILDKLPSSGSPDEQAVSVGLSNSFLEYLEKTRNNQTGSKTRVKRKLLNIQPGKSICTEDFNLSEESVLEFTSRPTSTPKRRRLSRSTNENTTTMNQKKAAVQKHRATSTSKSDLVI